MKALNALLILMMCGCTAGVKEKSTSTATPTATPALSYDCTYYSEYNDLNTCQTMTYANCTSSFKTFPNGGIAQCYAPVAGYEVCETLYALTPLEYTLTQWNYTCQNTVAGTAYRYRSIVECPSTICACLTAPDLLDVPCTIGVGTCSPPVGTTDINPGCQ